jgi:uncharacterized protein (TIGR02996 family)
MWPDCATDPTGLALLQGAKDHPGETDRRLILADWLEDHGEAEVANCLRRSLHHSSGWALFPPSSAQRWRPWNGCTRGWLGVRGQVAHLPDSPWFCALYPGEKNLGPAGAQALATAPALAHLCYLNLASNTIGPTGAQALAAANLGNLASLNLTANTIGDVGVQALAACSLTRLSELGLNSNAIGDVGVQALEKSRSLRHLTSLYLADNVIGPAGVQVLAQIQARGVRVVR